MTKFRSEIFDCVFASPYEGMSVGRSVRPSVTHELQPCKSAVLDQNTTGTSVYPALL